MNIEPSISPLARLHLGWEGYIRVEREQLAQRASGKMARMIAHVLPGESEEALRILVFDDQYTAQQGYVPLREGNTVFYKHIEELTDRDRWPRIAYEKTLVRWLRKRIEAEKSAAARLEGGEAGTAENR